MSVRHLLSKQLLEETKKARMTCRMKILLLVLFFLFFFFSGFSALSIPYLHHLIGISFVRST